MCSDPFCDKHHRFYSTGTGTLDRLADAIVIGYLFLDRLHRWRKSLG